MIKTSEGDIGRRVTVCTTGLRGRSGVIERLDPSYVWVLFDDETETYYGCPALRAVIRTILKWETEAR